MRRRLLLSASVCATVASGLLAGCATPLRSAPNAAAEVLSGRLSVQVGPHGEQGARNVSADFDLRGSSEQGELQLASPLGTVLAQARWRPGEVWLKQRDGERRFESLSALAAEVLGEPLPLGALFDWLRGRPWQGAPSVRSERGFEQLGWTVDLQRWNEGFMTAARGSAASAPSVTVRAKLAP